MPGWQRFYAERPDRSAEIVSVAVEHLGADAARPYVEEAGTAFPTVVDEQGQAGDRFGFKAVPNGVLVDEEGTVRYLKEGGFSVDNPDDVDAVRRFFAGEDAPASPSDSTPYALGPVEQDLVATKVRLGRALDEQGRRADAVAEWRAALRLDPENFLIRKQIWAAEHPERFHPTIDVEWQQGQLRREREQEIADGVCGPDGCPVPWVSPTAG